jgi:L-histidine N-alpha-methyltransferase
MKPARSAARDATDGECLAPISAVSDRLLRVDDRHDDLRGQLMADVLRGLTQPRKALPPKYFYDERGAQLFDAICDLPEYYLTRAEYALLETIAADVIRRVRPSHLVELGSGASRKTRLLLDAFVAACPTGGWYVPIDVSERMLRRTAIALRGAYPSLGVRAIVADYDRGVPVIEGAERRLVAFLGSTIGNFVAPSDVAFLRALRASLMEGDCLLLGVDLVKDAAVLHAAYNDAAGVTAEFNRNVLRVINRELGADFDPQRFEHVAYFDADAAQIEMYLRARSEQQVRIAALDLTVGFYRGESVHTESSRKFTPATVDMLLRDGGFRLEQWYSSPDDAFALALATVEGPA